MLGYGSPAADYVTRSSGSFFCYSGWPVLFENELDLFQQTSRLISFTTPNFSLQCSNIQSEASASGDGDNAVVVVVSVDPWIENPEGCGKNPHHCSNG
jgi:hypothetical protein